MVEFTKDIMGRLNLWTDVLQGVSKANSLAMQYAFDVGTSIQDKSFNVSAEPINEAMNTLITEQRRMKERDLRMENKRDLGNISWVDRYIDD
jgi:hypothetical protein